MGNLKKGAGVTEANKEISFQIRLVPSLSQLNTAPALINDVVLTGHDDFANVDIRVNKALLTTSLINDPAFPDGGERVEE